MQQEDWPEHSPWLRSTSTLGTVLQRPEKGACAGAALSLSVLAVAPQPVAAIRTACVLLGTGQESDSPGRLSPGGAQRSRGEDRPVPGPGVVSGRPGRDGRSERPGAMGQCPWEVVPG